MCGQDERAVAGGGELCEEDLHVSGRNRLAAAGAAGAMVPAGRVQDHRERQRVPTAGRVSGDVAAVRGANAARIDGGGLPRDPRHGQRGVQRERKSAIRRERARQGRPGRGRACAGGRRRGAHGARGQAPPAVGAVLRAVATTGGGRARAGRRLQRRDLELQLHDGVPAGGLADGGVGGERHAGREVRVTPV